MKLLRTSILLTAPLLLFFAVTTLLSPQVFADHNPGHIITGSFCENGQVLDDGACQIVNKDTGDASARNIFQVIGQTLVFIVGGLSFIMIIIGGLMYVLSSGDGNNTKRAKDVILYAIVGLVIAVSAQGLVTFVLGRI